MGDPKWLDYLLPLVIILAFWGLGLLLRRVGFDLLARAIKKTRWRWGDVINRAVRGWIIVWLTMIGVYLAVRMWRLPGYLLTIIDKILLALAIFSVTLALVKISIGFFRLNAEKIERTLPITSLTENFIKIIILCIGMLILLNGLGVSITPIITALGVGGLAVALALQDTLANLFAGLHVILAKQIKIGDYIRLESGEEGYVTDIGWRNVVIREISNNRIIIPNSKLAQSIITNYHFAEKKILVSIPIGVSYDSDPERVERILIDEAKKAAQEVEGLVSDEEPFVRFRPGFGDFSLDFTLYCHIKEFADLYLVEHELRKRIFKRFRQEGIEIPFPIRTVYVKGENHKNKEH